MYTTIQKFGDDTFFPLNFYSTINQQFIKCDSKNIYNVIYN